jgi:predicted ATPase
MISSFRISGFKLFRHLEVPRLGGLNLFVGKNNTGKSCLLEAIELYSCGSPRDVLRVALRREQDGSRRRRGEGYYRSESLNLLQPLFGLFHRDRGQVSQLLQIRLDAGRYGSELSIDCEPFLSDMIDGDLPMEKFGHLEPQNRQQFLREVLRDVLHIHRGDKKLRSEVFDRSLRGFPIPEEALEAEGWIHPDFLPVAFLPARGFTNEDAKRLWDKASLTDKDEVLLTWLRLVDREIRDLRYLSDSTSSSDLPYLKINGDRGRVSLSSQGDGLTRLFHIGLAMSDASRGILLIDEFENGLHWEVQKEIWSALLRASMDFGIQVFATTHSWDCIKAFVAAQAEILGVGENFVYRLERRAEDVVAVNLPLPNLQAALDNQVEVR